MGSQTSRLGLKQDRKSKFKESTRKYNDLFKSFDNLTITRMFSNSPIALEKQNSTRMNRSLEVVKEKK